MKARPILFSGDMVRAILDGRKTQTRRMVKPQPYVDKCGNFIWGKSNFGSDGLNPHIQKIAKGYYNNGVLKPYNKIGVIGDLLWVRESWVMENTREYHGEHDEPKDNRPILKFKDANYKDGYTHWHIPHYRATEPEPHIVCEGSDDDTTKWTPSIHMPRWASRITLEIIGVRVERLQDISEADAIAEGIENLGWEYSCTPWKNYNLKNGEPHCMNHSYPPASYKTLWESINGAGSWDANPWVWVIEFKPHLMNVDALVALQYRKEGGVMGGLTSGYKDCDGNELFIGDRITQTNFNGEDYTAIYEICVDSRDGAVAFLMLQGNTKAMEHSHILSELTSVDGCLIKGRKIEK